MAGILSEWNNRLTAVGTAVATIAAIFSAYNTYRINRLETRTKIENASYRFAELFLDKAMGSDSLKKHPRSVPAMLSILDIAAQASSSTTGVSNAEARAVLPIHLALLLEEPDTVAELDRDCRHLETWVDLAAVDSSDQTRVTAIKALVPLARKALIDRRLTPLHHAVTSIDRLLDLMRKADPPDATGAETGHMAPAPAPDVVKILQLRAAAVNARADLALFIDRNREVVKQAMVDKGASGNPEILRNEVLAAFPAAAAVEKVQDAQVQLRSVQATIQQQPTSESKAVANEIRQTLDRGNLVLATAATDAAHKVTEPATESAGSAPVPVVERQRTEDHLQELIKKLGTEDPKTRQQARSELAVFGQSAVKPLLALAQRDDVSQGAGASTAEKARLEKLNFELASTLARMPQPIALDAEDADAVIKLLRSDVRYTRSLIADFLMGLWDESSIHYVYFELEKIIQHAQEPKTGSAVQNAALIVATWARNLNNGIKSPERKVTMREFALQKVKDWRETLKKTHHEGGWGKTLAMLDELIPKAEAAQKADIAQTAQQN